MFDLIFGISWTLFASIFVYFLYFFDDEGQIVGNDSFVAQVVIWIFVAIGVWMIIKGVKKVLANRATSLNGKETYGLILDVYPSGNRVNGRHIWNADVMIVEESGLIGRYTESIGMSYNKYRVGDFVKLKHHKEDINIIETVNESAIPYHIKDKLDAEPEPGEPNREYNTGYTDAADTIVINGVEYERKR